MKGQGVGKMWEEVGCEGCEGNGMGVGLWEDGGHDEGRRRRGSSHYGAIILHQLMMKDSTSTATHHVFHLIIHEQSISCGHTRLSIPRALLSSPHCESSYVCITTY